MQKSLMFLEHFSSASTQSSKKGDFLLLLMQSYQRLWIDFGKNEFFKQKIAFSSNTRIIETLFPTVFVSALKSGTQPVIFCFCWCNSPKDYEYIFVFSIENSCIFAQIHEKSAFRQLDPYWNGALLAPISSILSKIIQISLILSKIIQISLIFSKITQN